MIRPRRTMVALGRVRPAHSARRATPRHQRRTDPRMRRFACSRADSLCWLPGARRISRSSRGFGFSSLKPTGTIPPEFAEFNNYDPRVDALLADQICATPYERQVEQSAGGGAGRIVAATGRCQPYAIALADWARISAREPACRLRRQPVRQAGPLGDVGRRRGGHAVTAAMTRSRAAICLSHRYFVSTDARAFGRHRGAKGGVAQQPDDLPGKFLAVIRHQNPLPLGIAVPLQAAVEATQGRPIASASSSLFWTPRAIRKRSRRTPPPHRDRAGCPGPIRSR